MSTRTIIEINHDYMHDLPSLWVDLVRHLQSGESWVPAERLKPCIRVLGQRHHSEPEWAQAATNRFGETAKAPGRPKGAKSRRGR